MYFASRLLIVALAASACYVPVQGTGIRKLEDSGSTSVSVSADPSTTGNSVSTPSEDRRLGSDSVTAGSVSADPSTTGNSVSTPSEDRKLLRAGGRRSV
jgi:hypothetical protein